MDAITVLTEKLTELARGLIAHAPNIVVAILVVLATWGAAKLVAGAVERLLPKGEERRSLRMALRKLSTIVVWVAGLALTAVVLFPSVKPSSMLAGLGLGSVAIGFAFKDIFENFFAGMLILFRQPFRLGDYIEVDDIEGKVETITIRDTLVRRTDGQPVIIPNSMLFKHPVTVRTDRDVRRVTVICGVAYGEDVDQARDVIENAVQGLDSVDDGQPVEIFAQGFGASSIDFEVTWWTGSKPLDVRRSRDQVVAAVKNALDSAGIEIPFPYRTLTFKEPLALDGDATERGARSANGSAEHAGHETN